MTADYMRRKRARSLKGFCCGENMITALVAETLLVWLLTVVLGLAAVFAVIRYRQETKVRN